MILEVINKELCIGQIQITGVASSGLVLIGDSNTIQLASTSDTPPEAILQGPFVPLAPQG